MDFDSADLVDPRMGEEQRGEFLIPSDSAWTQDLALQNGPLVLSLRGKHLHAVIGHVAHKHVTIAV